MAAKRALTQLGGHAEVLPGIVRGDRAAAVVLAQASACPVVAVVAMVTAVVA